MREAVPVVFMAFDLLYAGGEMMMEKPLEERRRALEELVEREQRANQGGQPLDRGGTADGAAI